MAQRFQRCDQDALLEQGFSPRGTRLDTDLLRRFRLQRGYQTRINAILRAYMEAQATI